MSVFYRSNHVAAVVKVDLVFNYLLSPFSTTRALKQLYDVPAARDPSATIALKIQLEASAPNYK